MLFLNISMPDDQSPSRSPSGSILDRVLSSQHAQAIEGFVPTETFGGLIKSLTDKEQEVLRRRFGLHGNAPQTLEEIGKLYHVTRERIRQIESGAVQKIRRSRQFRDQLGPIERLLLIVLNGHGGMMEEQAFFAEALSHAGNTPEQRRALLFILEQLLNHRFESRPSDEVFRASWKLKAQSLELVRQAVDTLTTVTREHGAPMTRDQLLDVFRQRPLYRQHENWFTDETVLAYVTLANQLARNPFGEFGLATWGTIVPKRMNDKIILIMRKHGKPMHFTEIAQRINEAGFDRRRAYPPTVHNELILNPEYVLVGRGIYALKEWGYKPGVVADVLVDILQRANRPLPRDELVAAVLRQRLVKRNTVLLALTNKKLFQRLPTGAYGLVIKS
ncbi:MAG: hypothetical protein HY567_02705 [Candidatus Kerfeldbacteria bacterium]|nr:hypothetical protein [Candidatus Kerfeldbacteria bacterium]